MQLVISDQSRWHLLKLTAGALLGQVRHGDERILQSFFGRDPLIALKMQQPLQEVQKRLPVCIFISTFAGVDLESETD